METELGSLYNILKIYKESLIRSLYKIDENISQAVANYDNVHTKISPSKKFKISMEMVEVLQSYVKMLFTSENIAEELLSKISALERHCQPERDTSPPTLNPFDASNIEAVETSEPPLSLPISTFFQEKINHSTDSIVESDADTVVNQSPELLETKYEPLEHIKEEVDSDYPPSSNSSDITTDTLITDTAAETDISPVKIEKCEEEEINSTNCKPEKSTRQVKFNIPEKQKTAQSKEKQPGDAVQKLLKMPPYDWREEAKKLFENKNLRKTFKWVSAGTALGGSPQGDNDKKVKEKCTAFDDELCVRQSCVFSHVESPSEFYIRTYQDLFESLESALNEDLNISHSYVINKYKSKSQAKNSLGNFCFGFLSTRRKWVRIEVLDWMDNDPENIFVQLIDYGETFHWTFRNLKAMTEFYAVFPKMAIRCHFAGIYSPKNKAPSKWPKVSCQFLYDLSEMKKMTKFITIYVHKEGNSYAVDLQKESNPNSDTLGQIMVQKGYALEVTISESDNLSEIDIEEFDTLNEAIAGYDAQDEARICPFSNKNGKCFKGPSCKLEHGQLSADGITTDKILTTSQALTQIILPSPGEVVEILITGYIDTCHFYAQILRSNRNTAKANDDFQSLQETMGANNIVQTYESFKLYPAIGEHVLVKEESNWMRGCCTGYKENDVIEVFLVDYGYKTAKHLRELKMMKEQFLYVPFQAIECILSDCQEKKDVGQLSQQFFYNCLCMKIFSAHVVESTVPLRVKLWDQNHMEMSYILKQAGLGEDRDKDFYPSKTCILSCD